MIARITPKDGASEFAVECGSPTWNDRALYGYGDATVPAELTLAQVSHSVGASIVIEGANGPVYSGLIWDAAESGIVCQGEVAKLDLMPYRSPWKVTTPQLYEYVKNGRKNVFARETPEGVLKVGQSAGQLSVVNDFGGWYLWHPSREIVRIEFDCYVNHSGVTAAVYSSATEGVYTTSKYGQTATGLSTGQSVDFGSATFGCVIACLIEAAETPSQFDKYVEFRNLVVYYRDIYASPYVPTYDKFDDASDIVTLLANAKDYPLDHIESGAPALPSLDVNGTDLEMLSVLVSQTEWQFAMRHRLSGGSVRVSPIWRPRPVSPRYRVDVASRNVQDGLRYATMDAIRDSVRFTYTDVAGRERIFYYPTDAGYCEDIKVATTDYDTAYNAAKTIYDAGQLVTATGTIGITGIGVTTIDGAPVPPDLIEAGELILVVGGIEGARLGFIENVAHVGESGATLSLGSATTIPKAIRQIVGG